jgi:hypothetical protein
MSDTPETDAFIASQNHSLTTHQLKNFARILERERDEARTELEMWRDGNIMHQIHRDELEKVEREREEARELLASEKITRDHVIKRGIEMQKERDEAIEKHRFAVIHWQIGVAKMERERDEAREEHRKLKIILDVIKKETL